MPERSTPELPATMPTAYGAERLGVSVPNVQRWVDAGHLHSGIQALPGIGRFAPSIVHGSACIGQGGLAFGVDGEAGSGHSPCRRLGSGQAERLRAAASTPARPISSSALVCGSGTPAATSPGCTATA